MSKNYSISFYNITAQLDSDQKFEKNKIYIAYRITDGSDPYYNIIDQPENLKLFKTKYKNKDELYFCNGNFFEKLSNLKKSLKKGVVKNG